MNKKGVLLGFLLLIGACLPATAVWGDGDGNGTFDNTDVARALCISSGLLEADAADLVAVDVEPTATDGRIGIPDAVRLARVLAGLDHYPLLAPLAGDFTLTVTGAGTNEVFVLAGGL